MNKEKWIEDRLSNVLDDKLCELLNGSDKEMIEALYSFDFKNYIEETRKYLEEEYEDNYGAGAVKTNKGINMALTNCEIAEVNDYLFSDEDVKATNMMMGSMISMLEVKADIRIAQMKENGFDHLNLYLTDLTPALIAVINACWANKMFLTVYHYDKENDMYVPQEVFKSANIKNDLTFGV